ncbi:MAG TPA: hypothetical protein PKE40_10400 [Arachnia sp.]|nr:hypothetical protein [Arachnia sp.]
MKIKATLLALTGAAALALTACGGNTAPSDTETPAAPRHGDRCPHGRTAHRWPAGVDHHRRGHDPVAPCPRCRL